MKNSRMWRWLGCFVIALVMSLGVKGEASAQSFTDVSSKHPYRDMIQDIEKRGLISGYPDGTFRPNEKISRKHVAKLLDKALKLESKTGAAIHYKDVPKNHPYYDAISRVSKAGIFSGDLNGKFNPEAPLTRIQMAKVLDLAFELNVKALTYFGDVYNYHWGYIHVNALYSNGITTGDQGYFKPNQPVTRAHYAVFLSRALSKPGIPEASTNPTLTKEGIVNLIYRLSRAVENTLVDNKGQAKQFSVVRPELLKNATQSFTDVELKEYYAGMCIDCDGHFFPHFSDEMNYRFEILENTPNSVHIRTVTFDVMGPNSTGEFIEYAFEKQAGKWKLSGFDLDPIGAGSLELTKEEAIQIVKSGYLNYESTTARVTFLNSGYDYVYDWYTKRDHRRVVYHMHVKTDERSFNIAFYPHNGRYDEE